MMGVFILAIIAYLMSEAVNLIERNLNQKELENEKIFLVALSLLLVIGLVGCNKNKKIKIKLAKLPIPSSMPLNM